VNDGVGIPTCMCGVLAFLPIPVTAYGITMANGPKGMKFVREKGGGHFDVRLHDIIQKASVAPRFLSPLPAYSSTTTSTCSYVALESRCYMYAYM